MSAKLGGIVTDDDSSQFIGVHVLKTWSDAELRRRVVSKSGRLGPVRKNRLLDVAARHNLREFPGDGGGKIDRTRSKHNRVLFGPTRASDVTSRALHLCQANGIAVHAGALLTTKERDRLKLIVPEGHEVLRADTARACEVVISLPSDSTIDERAFFDDALEWARTFFARCGTLLSAVVHLDQGRAHMHLLYLPLQGFATMSGTPFTRRDRLVLMHANFHAVVGVKYGLADLISTQDRYQKALERMAA